MKSAKVLLVIIPIIIGVSLSCKLLKDKVAKTTVDAPKIDFTKPANGLDVKVELDKTQTASQKIGKSGGSVSLTAADGSKFTLEVPADALDAETTITITAVKTIDGAPLDNKSSAAVQMEPSGLFFKEFATLTIVPAKEIPVKNQVAFGYEGDGKDYHLAPVDPKSEDIKIKLIQFSGAGVGSASDTAWAANLAIQASNASTRIMQKFAEYTRAERMKALLGDESGSTYDLKPFLDQFEDQVVLKEMVAAELDCKHAFQALKDLIFLERMRQLLGFESTRGFTENFAKLLKLAKECRRPFRANGSSNNVSFTGEICSLDLPFSINAKYPGGTATTSFTPSGRAAGGSTEVSGGGGGCAHTGGGTYNATPNEDGSSTLTWTTTDTIACPGFSNTRTATFTLPLQPAPELSCP